jgi:hypothetical protein
MVNYEKASEEVVKLFDEIIRDNTNLTGQVEIELLCNDNQKELIKISKLNDLVGKLTEGLNFAVVVNEKIFDQLPIDMQKIALIESVSGISVSDNGTISNNKPDFTTYTGVLQVYGHEAVIRMKESIKSLYDAEKNKEDKEKEAKKAKIEAAKAARKAHKKY